MKVRPPKPPGFIGNLDTRLLDEFSDKHQLRARFSFYSAILGTIVTAPKGFITDFASVPRMVGAYLLFGGKGKRAAVIHDLLYSLGMLDPIKWPRALCDRIFKEALEASGYSAFTVSAMYAAVCVGGGSHYAAPNLDQPVAIDAAQREAP